MVYAFIYTLFLVISHDTFAHHDADRHPQGFGLSFGSDLYLAVSSYGRHNLVNTANRESQFLHGSFLTANKSAEVQDLPGTFTFLDTTTVNHIVVKGQSLIPSTSW